MRSQNIPECATRRRQEEATYKGTDCCSLGPRRLAEALLNLAVGLADGPGGHLARVGARTRWLPAPSRALIELTSHEFDLLLSVSRRSRSTSLRLESSGPCSSGGQGTKALLVMR
jgi:hypothetical protein